MVRYKNRYLVMRAELRDGKRTSASAAAAAAASPPSPPPPPPPAAAADGDLSPALSAACRDAVASALGPAALAAALPALSARFHAPSSGVCVVRCARDGHDRLAAALCRRVTLVALRSASLSLLGAHGAPRTARAAALEHHWRLLAATALVEGRVGGGAAAGDQAAATVATGEGNPSEEARRVAQAQLQQRKRRRRGEALAAAAAADALRLAAAEL